MSTATAKPKIHIEEYINKECTIREDGRCYIPMFKYNKEEGEEHWCFMLPVQTLYLTKITDAKKMVADSIVRDEGHGWSAEYRLAKIVNPKKPKSTKMGRARVDNLDRQTGEVTIKIDALGTQYVPKIEKNSSTMLYNGAPLLEGINLLMKHGYLGVNAMKDELEARSKMLHSDMLAKFLERIKNHTNSGRVEFETERRVDVKKLKVGDPVIIISPWGSPQFKGIDIISRFEDHPNFKNAGGLVHFVSGRRANGRGSIQGTPYDYFTIAKPIS